MFVSGLFLFIYCIFIINNIICFNNVFGWQWVENHECTYTSTLSSLYPESSIGKIELIENIDNGFARNFIGLDGSYQSQNGGYYSKKLGVKMTLFNTGCTGTEEIIIKVYGEKVSGDVDNVFVMSQVNSDGNTNFISAINDWDGKLNLNGLQGGVYIAPDYNDELFEINNNNLIDTMFNGTKNINEYYSRLGNGDIKMLSTENSQTVGYKTSPLTYHIWNYIKYEYVYFQMEWINESNDEQYYSAREFKNNFDVLSGNDYIIGLGSDENRIKYDKFDVTIKCYESVLTSEIA